MFFNKIRLVASTTVSLPHLGLASPTDVFILKGADGLGPTENDVFLANTARSGGYYQGRRSQSREITLLVGLNPSYAIGQTSASLRDTVYGLLTSEPGAKNLEVMTVQLMDGDSVVAQTEGYLKHVPINPFSNEPQVQIIISCPSQYFQGETSDDFTADDADDLVVTNVGTAPTGFLFTQMMTGATTEFTIQDRIDIDEEGVQFMTLNDLDLEFGDQLVIDTRPGSRELYYIPVGFTHHQNLLGKLSDESSWIQLRPGANHLYWSSASYDDSLLVTFNHLYWGV